jgi:hypothetical protein
MGIIGEGGDRVYGKEKRSILMEQSNAEPETETSVDHDHPWTTKRITAAFGLIAVFVGIGVAAMSTQVVIGFAVCLLGSLLVAILYYKDLVSIRVVRTDRIRAYRDVGKELWMVILLILVSIVVPYSIYLAPPSASPSIGGVALAPAAPTPPPVATVGQTFITDAQRIQFDKALRYRILTNQVPEGVPVHIYADATNETRARVLAEMLLTAGWKPARDSTDNFALRPDFNVGPGITVRHPSGPDTMKAWDALRQALATAHVHYEDSATGDAGVLTIEVGH